MSIYAINVLFDIVFERGKSLDSNGQITTYLTHNIAYKLFGACTACLERQKMLAELRRAQQTCLSTSSAIYHLWLTYIESHILEYDVRALLRSCLEVRYKSLTQIISGSNMQGPHSHRLVVSIGVEPGYILSLFSIKWRLSSRGSCCGTSILEGATFR